MSAQFNVDFAPTICIAQLGISDEKDLVSVIVDAHFIGKNMEKNWFQPERWKK